MKYKTLAELVAAHKSAEIKEVLWLDNDDTHVYVGKSEDDPNPECVFSMHPSEVLEQALDLLGVPAEHV